MRTLDAGASNFSILVSDEQQHWVVRIDGVNPALHGLNRQAEWRILQDAAAHGLAPIPRYFNPELGALVYDYLPADAMQDCSMETLAELLRSIHSLAPRRHRVNLRERIGAYEKRARTIPSTIATTTLAQHGHMASLLSALDDEATDAVLCHNDLLRSNRLFSGGRLRALDWEYAAMASPWYELAVIIGGDQLTEDARDALVTAYLRRDPTASERDTLQAYITLYRYIELLWYLTLGRTVLSPQDYEARLSALLACTRSPA